MGYTMEKTLLFIPAYLAERSITEVINRVYRLNDERISEVLVIDDCSSDDTFNILHKIKSKRREISVLRNAHTLGYGGNLKRGYSYAIENDYDIILTLHGDGQHFPEDVPRLLDQLMHDKEISLTFASRINGNTSKSGMPVYKQIANKVLTAITNRLYGTRFTEVHSGFRAYRVSTLKRIDYLSFSDGYLFDFQVLSELMRRRSKITEVPCLTKYDSTTRSISFFDSLRYGIGCLSVCLSKGKS